MRQIRIAKVIRRKDRRYDDDAVLPLDPRDPDIVRAKQAHGRPGNQPPLRGS